MSGIVVAGSGRSALRGPTTASLYRIYAIVRHQAIVMSRSPHRLFDIMVQPALTLLLYGGISLVVAPGTTTATTAALYLIGGGILWNSVHQAQVSLVSGTMEELGAGTLLELIVSPLRMWEFLIGVALFGMGRTLVSSVVISLLAWAAYGFNVLTVGPWLAVVVVLLVISGWSVALLVIGAVLRFGLGAEVLVWALLAALIPLSGAFYPIQNLPAFLHPVADVLPFQHVFLLARDAAAGHIPGNDLLWAVTGTVVLLALAVGYLTAMTRVFLRRGYVTRHM
jgi:ABC-2 type transport system permease protein